MRTALFVCTGNYYRSRMAEEIFNVKAYHHGLNWRAGSAGLRSDMSASPNVGPISEYALAMLGKGDYPVRSPKRMPRSVVSNDFKSNDIVICLNRPEHRPVIEKRFPGAAEGVIYWEVADVGELEPEIAFQKIEFEIIQLITTLKSDE